MQSTISFQQFLKFYVNLYPVMHLKHSSANWFNISQLGIEFKVLLIQLFPVL